MQLSETEKALLVHHSTVCIFQLVSRCGSVRIVYVMLAWLVGRVLVLLLDALPEEEEDPSCVNP